MGTKESVWDGIISLRKDEPLLETARKCIVCGQPFPLESMNSPITICKDCRDGLKEMLYGNKEFKE